MTPANDISLVSLAPMKQTLPLLTTLGEKILAIDNNETI
jgi:hypothetical protein